MTSLGLPRPPGTASDAFRLGLVVPLQGPAGIYGPSCEACAQLAVEELNLGNGLLGREVELVTIDGGATPAQVADQVQALVTTGSVDALTGWHISPVRQAILGRIAGLVPYVYPTLYEGGERSPGIFLAGETPTTQVAPALRWLVREHGIERWYVVGNDYVWPRRTAQLARRYVHAAGGEVCDGRFVPLGTRDFAPVLRAIERQGAAGVLMLLVGHDAVLFNRAFAASGLDDLCVRFSPLMCEDMLLGSGAASTHDIYSAAAYFDELNTTDNCEFRDLYARRFGDTAPTLNSQGESCYEAVQLLAALLHRADSADPVEVAKVADSVGYSGPRGAVHLRDGHLQQDVYLARANGLEFDIVTAL